MKEVLKAKVRVEVRNSRGKLVGVRERESDLILENFRDILAAILWPEELLTSTDYRAAGVVDLAGTGRSLIIRTGRTVSSGMGHGWLCVDNTTITVGVRIRVGTSTVAPARGDYKLGAEVDNGVPTITVGVDYISWAVSIVLDAAADVAESGLSIMAQLRDNVAPEYVHVLLFRDTFTTISVPAGGTISVTYTLTL